MSAKKTVAPDFTIAGLAQQVIKEFEFYGFKTENPVARLEVYRHGPSGSIKLVFDEQRATGQAAFSQDKVSISASIYLGDEIKNRPDLKPWQIWQVDTLAVLSPEDRARVMEHGAAVKLEVHYTHHDGGSNGKSISYVFKGGKLTRAAR